jgi:hypothetical protein
MGSCKSSVVAALEPHSLTPVPHSNHKGSLASSSSCLASCGRSAQEAKTIQAGGGVHLRADLPQEARQEEEEAKEPL